MAAKKKRAAKKKTHELLAVNALSERTGVDRRTVRKRLIEAGKDPRQKHRLADVQEIIAPPKPDDDAPIREKKVYEDWRWRKLQNDEKEGMLVSRSWIAEQLRKYVSECCDVLDNTLVNEAPPLIVPPEDVPAARIQIRRFVDAAKEKCQKLNTILDDA